MAQPALLRRMAEIDTIAGYMGPAEFRAGIARWQAQWQALVDEIGLQPEG